MFKIFKNSKFLRFICSTGTVGQIFVKIGRTVAEILQFNGFLKCWPSAILDLLDAYELDDECFLVVCMVLQNLVEN